jgi:hypothetical protein
MENEAVVTIEAESLPTVARITVRKGDVSHILDVEHDEIDDLGIVGLVRRVAAALEEVQK